MNQNTLVIPEDSMLCRHILMQLRAEVEAGIIPKQTDDNLKHYHAANVAAENSKTISTSVTKF